MHRGTTSGRPPRSSVRGRSWPGHDGRDRGRAPRPDEPITGLASEGRTGRVDTDLSVPAGVDADHPAPAVLTTDGFGGTEADQADLAQGLGEQGYVVPALAGLGSVDGDLCLITLDDRAHDGAATGQLLRPLGGGQVRYPAGAVEHRAGPTGRTSSSR